MAFSYINKVLSKGEYWGWFLIPAIIIGILYLTVFADTTKFGALGPAYLIFNWIFAVTMPLLIGLVIAIQVYNLKESKTCPVTGTTTGSVGSLIGISSVACPVCPAIFLGWFGLGTAVSSAVLSSVWFKALSLVLLVAALIFATKGRQ